MRWVWSLILASPAVSLSNGEFAIWVWSNLEISYFFNRRHGYYIFLLHIFFVWLRGRLLFQGGVYFFGKPADTDGWIGNVRVIGDDSNTVSSKHCLSVLLSTMEMGCTTPTALVLVQWSIIRNYLHMCACANYSFHSYYSRIAFISLIAPDCVATIQAWQLFEGGVYWKKYGSWKGMK